MPEPTPSGDNMTGRLYALNVSLSERLAEAADIRGRFTKALDANVWPDLGSLSRLLATNRLD
jgi:hypothetical protein